MAEDFQCTISGLRVTIEVKVDETLQGRIVAGQIIKLDMNPIRNPTSQKPSEPPYQIEVLSDKYFEVAR